MSTDTHNEQSFSRRNIACCIIYNKAPATTVDDTVRDSSPIFITLRMMMMMMMMMMMIFR